MAKDIKVGDPIAYRGQEYEKRGVVTKIELRDDGYLDITFIDMDGDQAIQSSRVLCPVKY